MLFTIIIIIVVVGLYVTTQGNRPCTQRWILFYCVVSLVVLIGDSSTMLSAKEQRISTVSDADHLADAVRLEVSADVAMGPRQAVHLRTVESPEANGRRRVADLPRAGSLAAF